MSPPLTVSVLRVSFQLRAFGEAKRGDRSDQLGVRFNPGLGSGGTGKTNVGGPSSSFGIWHELMPQVHCCLGKGR